MTRQEKIFALTKYELEWFLSNGDNWVKDTADFFSEGGFNKSTDEELDELMRLKWGDDDNPVIHILDGRTLGKNEETIR
jgi:N-acetylglutamate synthase-like GNAT family acetyltransferase